MSSKSSHPVSAETGTPLAAGKASTNSFCIDALLARAEPPRGSPSPAASPSHSSNGSPPTSPRISPGANSPYPRSSSSHSNHGQDPRSPVSPFWNARASGPSANGAAGGSGGGNPQHLFQSAIAGHPLYAAMYGSASALSAGHPHGLPPNSSGSVPMMHGSAFHSPLHDLKGHPVTGGLSMDWLARAGLLYHRSSGK